jgi:hypothetical protein
LAPARADRRPTLQVRERRIVILVVSIVVALSLCVIVWVAIAHFVSSLLHLIKKAAHPAFDPAAYLSRAGWLPIEFALLRKVRVRSG